MKQFSGYDEAKKAAQYKGGRLPVGGYVCKVLDVKYEASKEEDKSDRIVLRFDIAEGDHKDFFTKLYEGNTSEDKRYKGVVNIYVPKDDGSEKDGWTKNTFGRWINAFEESNPGYSWDWDEKKFKGKLVGIVFGETGTVIDGKEITFTEARSGASVAEIRDGSYYKAKFIKRNGYTGNGGNEQTKTNMNDYLSVPDSNEEEIPF